MYNMINSNSCAIIHNNKDNNINNSIFSTKMQSIMPKTQNMMKIFLMKKIECINIILKKKEKK